LFPVPVRSGGFDPRRSGRAPETSGPALVITGLAARNCRGGAMSRRYGDPIEVRSGSGPEQFLWRGRLYVVRSVLAHWIEVGPWWHFASVLDLERAGTDRIPEGTQPRSAAESAEREVWRVEATSGRAIAPGIYDLCRDGAVDWCLVRTID
jgi:hypothetical protein